MKKLKSPNKMKALASLITIIISLLISLIVFICISAEDAFYEFSVLVTGGLTYFGLSGLLDILANAAPLICCGLCILFAFKTGLFNIGAAGQYVMGSFGALVFALQFKCPWFISILISMVFGAIWGVIPAILKALCKVSEVISGIMLNWISLYFVNYSFQTYLNKCVSIQDGAKTHKIVGEFKIPTIGDNLSISIFIAILMVVII